MFALAALVASAPMAYASGGSAEAYWWNAVKAVQAQQDKINEHFANIHKMAEAALATQNSPVRKGS